MTDEDIYQAPSSNLDFETNDKLEFAGFWIRVLASIIDTILIMLVTYPLLTVIYGLDYWASDSFLVGFWDLLISYVMPAIAIVLFWVYRSATPGKILLGLQIISLGDTKKLSVGQSIGRYLAYFPSMFCLFIGIIWVAFDKRKQGWHDKLANTAVVKRR